MNALHFDSLSYANRLKAAGMEPQLAEVQAFAMADVLHVNMQDLATKQDVTQSDLATKHGFQVMQEGVQQEFQNVRNEMA